MSQDSVDTPIGGLTRYSYAVDPTESSQGREGLRTTAVYDAMGDEASGTANSSSIYTLAYDSLNRVAAVQEPYGMTLTMQYDTRGNRTQVADVTGYITTSIYDADHNLTSRSLQSYAAWPNARVDLGYTALNQISQTTVYNDIAGSSVAVTGSYGYDAAGEITNLQYKTASATNIANYTYAYDHGGNLQTETRNGTVTSYSYDQSNQLQGDGLHTYTYDGTGNRTNPGYTTTTGNELSSNGTWTYTYDNEGDLTYKVNSAGLNWTYKYDNKNELIEAQQRTATGVLQIDETYTYDAYGNLIQLMTGVSSGQRYAYDGWNPPKADAPGTANFDLYARLNLSDLLWYSYLHGDQVDQTFAWLQHHTASYYLQDRLGSVRDIVDSTGTVQEHLDYDAWGNIVNDTNASYDPYGYKWTGRIWDQGTGLQQNRDRWYDPTTGRWMSQDRSGFSAGDSNLYRYVENQPSESSDPSGMQPWWERTGSYWAVYHGKSRWGSLYTLDFVVHDSRPGGLPPGLTVAAQAVTIRGKAGNLEKKGVNQEPMQVLEDSDKVPVAATSWVRLSNANNNLGLGSRPLNEPTGVALGIVADFIIGSVPTVTPPSKIIDSLNLPEQLGNAGTIDLYVSDFPPGVYVFDFRLSARILTNITNPLLPTELKTNFSSPFAPGQLFPLNINNVPALNQVTRNLSLAVAIPSTGRVKIIDFVPSADVRGTNLAMAVGNIQVMSFADPQGLKRDFT